MKLMLDAFEAKVSASWRCAHRLNWSICNRAPNYRVKKPNTIVIPLDTIDQLVERCPPHHFANGDCEKKRNSF
jgi:hypothetical protein